jgi:hypothetical protein
MTFGYMLGCVFDDMDMGINIFSLFIMFFVCGSGLYYNLKTAHAFGKAMGYISPFRYTLEKLFRTLLEKTKYVETLADGRAFDFKDKAVPIAGTFIIDFFIMGWTILVGRAAYM